MDYTFYDTESGEILFTVSSNTQPDDSNGSYIEGCFKAEDYRVQNGIAVKKDFDEIESNALSLAWLEFRKLRDGKLADSDWTQIPDSPLNEEQKAAWAEYRQALRDLPDSYDGGDIVFPVQPNS